MTKQLMPIPQYVELVKQAGIEEAYRMRHRGTGRTIRDILRLCIMLSEGKHVEIRTTAEPGRTSYYAMQVLTDVLKTCDSLGMRNLKTHLGRAQLDSEESGGSIRLVTGNANRHGERSLHTWEVYELHGA